MRVDKAFPLKVNTFSDDKQWAAAQTYRKRNENDRRGKQVVPETAQKSVRTSITVVCIDVERARSEMYAGAGWASFLPTGWQAGTGRSLSRLRSTYLAPKPIRIISEKSDGTE